jgi:tyrosinase
MAQTRIRRDVWKLAAWDPILLWYAKAVGAMLKKPLNDPLSWRYQAAIHEYKRNKDPLAKASDVLPSNAEQLKFWNQCQHGSWFFLSWHRMYLSCFERIIMKTVHDLGGPNDWALPYWNYSDSSNANAKKLPKAFREAKLPDGSPNPLRVQQRAAAANSGAEVADDQDVALKDCLKEHEFSAPVASGSPSFGGPRVRAHSGGTAGQLERIPHGSMHNAVGDGGWMSFFYTAALDPIFWLHHCNIDRLWEVWLRRDATHKNPTQATWLTTEKFDLHDQTGAVTTMSSSRVIDSTASPLLYKYEDVSDPLGGLLHAQPLMKAEEFAAFEEGFMPEMVGATEAPVTLTGDRVTTSLAVNEPTGPGLFAKAAGKPRRRVYLNIENITGEGYPGSYSVYLNMPPEAHHTEPEEHYAGLLPMFGVSESTDPTREHPANGLQYTLDITDLVHTLQAQNKWDPNKMHVTFVPKRRGAAKDETKAPVKVGRVSLYYS